MFFSRTIIIVFLAAYLTDQSFSCVRRLSTPSTDCTSLPALNAKNYANGFKVVMVRF